MPADFKTLEDKPRILIEVALKPVAGTRIQPTGFPDLGPAVYDAPDGKGSTVPTLLVESAQSMANRLEATCWDDANDDIAPELEGLPFVKVNLAGLGGGTDTTNSLLEFHRLNSPYIMTGVTKDGTTFADVLKPELGMVAVAATARRSPGRRAAGAEPDCRRGRRQWRQSTRRRGRSGQPPEAGRRLLQVRPELAGPWGVSRKDCRPVTAPAALSSFIEASGVGRADSGGVKFDRALPKPKVAGVDAKGGYGNVPFHRTEFTAKSITVYFSLDLAQIRGYGLGEDAADLLIMLSLWKVRRFLDSNMRLRTACELELLKGDESIQVTRPEGFKLRTTAELAKDIAGLIKKCKPQFAEPTVTELTWNKP